MALSAQRAGAAAPDLAPTTETAPTDATTCRCMDRPSLASELAVARAKLLLTGEVLGRPERRLSLPAGGPTIIVHDRERPSTDVVKSS